MDGTNEEKLNPFEQPPILQAIFKQLSFNELVKFRLVNKLWYAESLSTLRSNATIIFKKDRIVSLQEDSSARSTSVGEFLDLWEAGGWAATPFTKFNLDEWEFKAEDAEQERFMELVGPHIILLKLWSCSFVGRNHFRKTIYQAFPNLQVLKLVECEVDNVRHWSEPMEEILEYKEPAFGLHGLKSLEFWLCHPHPMMDVLSHFHKLTKLHLHFYEEAVGAPRHKCYQKLLEAIGLIRTRDHTSLPLTNFDVKFEIELGEHADYFIELLETQEQLHLPLQCLKIKFFSHFNYEDVIRNILQYHSSTLRHLEFDGQRLSRPFPPGFCQENLEELKVISTDSFPSRNNLNYLRYTPNLRHLDISNSSPIAELEANIFSNSTQLEIGDWTLPTLRKLTYFGLSRLSPVNLGKLMRWMPNVEELRIMKLDNVQFSMVCKNWKNLKDLEDWGSELTDEAVIGTGKAIGAGGEEEAQSDPNITQLQNLTSFGTQSSKLTSASVHDGFLKLTKLKTLWLPESTKFDEEAKAALERRKIKLYFI